LNTKFEEDACIKKDPPKGGAKVNGGINATSKLRHWRKIIFKKARLMPKRNTPPNRRLNNY
tara:strand:- start:892 stop:1074 length:183 start_codon:yes stop_codon:yes gene_type:complete